MPPPDITELRGQGIDQLIDVVHHHEPGGGVVQVEALADIGHESLQLPQHEAVHGEGLRPQQLQDTAGGQPAAGRRRGWTTVIGLVDEIGHRAQRIDVVVGEAHLSGLDVREAHRPPESSGEREAGTGALGHLPHAQSRDSTEKQALVTGESGPLDVVRHGGAVVRSAVECSAGCCGDRPRLLLLRLGRGTGLVGHIRNSSARQTLTLSVRMPRRRRR